MEGEVGHTDTCMPLHDFNHPYLRQQLCRLAWQWLLGASLKWLCKLGSCQADSGSVQLHVALDDRAQMQAKMDEGERTIAEQQAQLAVMQQQLDDCRTLLKSRVRPATGGQ